METAKSHNAKLTGEIEITRIPDNEFSNDLEYMPTADSAYSAELKFYNKKVCVQCGFKWLEKKTEPVQSDLCYKCRKENISKLIEQNKDNL